METNKEIKHTPLPFYQVECAGNFNIQNGPMYNDMNLLDADTVGYETAKTNAEFIVKACNNHPTLVEALKAIEARISGEFDSPLLLKYGYLTTDTQMDVLSIIEKTLKNITP